MLKAKMVVVAVMATLAIDGYASSVSCGRGQEMANAGSQAAQRSMSATDSIINGAQKAFRDTNSTCFNALRSINVAAMVPPLPLPSAVGAVVGKIMQSTINNQFQTACNSATASVQGTLSKANVALPGGMGQIGVTQAFDFVKTNTLQSGGAAIGNGATQMATNQILSATNPVVNQAPYDVATETKSGIGSALSGLADKVSSIWR